MKSLRGMKPFDLMRLVLFMTDINEPVDHSIEE